MKLWTFLLGIMPVASIIKGYNHYGLETPHQGFTCDWVHQPEYYMDELVKLGRTYKQFTVQELKELLTHYEN